jgi:Domain of unknown function (DUF4386)
MMNAMPKTNWTHDTRPRTAALVAGIGLLVMAVIAALSNFGVINSLTVPGDAGATARNLVNSAVLFRLGAVGLIVVAVLDVVVAWALYVVLRTVNPSLSLLGAWFRLAYAAIFAAAISSLFSALRAAPVEPTETLFLLKTFDQGWHIGLVAFGLHLGVVGLLVWRPGFFSRLVSVLLAVAAVGYIVDSLGTLLSPTYSLGLSAFTFVGEVVFIFWLLILGGKLAATQVSE